MRDILDLHTHTIVSGHAYNTIWEMASGAAKKGLELLGITEHAPKMPGSCHEFYFSNLKIVPREIDGMRLLLGAELNIMDRCGNVDLPSGILKQMDVTIGSIHMPCFVSESREENTESYINAMKNPYINIIGHPDDGRVPVDYEALVQAAKEYHVLLEVNNNSLNPEGFRKDTLPNDRTMLKLCMKYQVPVIMGSDAHVVTEIGNHARIYPLLEELAFPEELVVNRSVDVLMEFVNTKKWM